MISSPIFKHISKKHNYFGVNKSYFIAIFFFNTFLMMASKNLLLAVTLFALALAIGALFTKKDPDFFDILIQSYRFKWQNKVHKVNGNRVWEP